MPAWGSDVAVRGRTAERPTHGDRLMVEALRKYTAGGDRGAGRHGRVLADWAKRRAVYLERKRGRGRALSTDSGCIRAPASPPPQQGLSARAVVRSPTTAGAGFRKEKYTREQPMRPPPSAPQHDLPPVQAAARGSLDHLDGAPVELDQVVVDQLGASRSTARSPSRRFPVP